MANSMFVMVFAAIVGTVDSRAHEAATKQGAELLQTYERALNGEDNQGRSSPVTRVVNLLEAMSQTTKKEMGDDEKQYRKLSCWCNNNEYAKEGAIKDATDKVAELEAMIESYAARIGELSSTVGELRKELDADKTALKEAIALRQNQQKEFHTNRVEATKNIQNIKAALGVLDKNFKKPASFLARREPGADALSEGEDISREPDVDAPLTGAEDISRGPDSNAQMDAEDISRGPDAIAQKEAEDISRGQMEAEDVSRGPDAIAQKEAEDISRGQMEAEDVSRGPDANAQMEAEDISRGQMEAEDIPRGQMEAEVISRGQMEAEDIPRPPDDGRGQMEAENIPRQPDAEDISRLYLPLPTYLNFLNREDPLGHSFLALRSRKRRGDDFWNPEAKLAHQGRLLDNFMRVSGLDDVSAPTDTMLDNSLLQNPPEQVDKSVVGSASANGGGWSIDDEDLVKNALRIGNAFLQARNEQGYYPSYSAQSGEVVGILKQMLDEMQSSLADAEKKEKADASAFEELRAAKAEEIASAEKMEEEKEDDLATSENSLAQSKKDLKLKTAELQEAQAFKKQLGTSCAEAETNFQARKAASLVELKALGETIEILSADEARYAMKSTYAFFQRSTTTSHSALRRKAALKLRAAARQFGDTQMAFLATSIELDAFEKVKKAIDDMVADLNQQMKDEVVKVDHCKSELQQNEKMTAKAQDKVEDLTAKSQALSTQVKGLQEEVAKAKAAIAQLQGSEQQAGEERLAQSIAFQKLIVDQTLSIEVMNKAIDRLTEFYSKKESLLQVSKGSEQGGDEQGHAQSDHSPNKAGASGVINLLKELIQEVKDMIAKARKDENKAQANYKAMIDDTVAEIDGLQKQVTNKERARVAATRDERDIDSDIEDLNKDLAGLANLNGQLHLDCDYVLKNFDLRQKARTEEIESLRQVKQILNGAAS